MLEITVMAILVPTNEVKAPLRIGPRVIAVFIEVSFRFIDERTVLLKKFKRTNPIRWVLAAIGH